MTTQELHAGAEMKSLKQMMSESTMSEENEPAAEAETAMMIAWPQLRPPPVDGPNHTFCTDDSFVTCEESFPAEASEAQARSPGHSRRCGHSEAGPRAVGPPPSAVSTPRVLMDGVLLGGVGMRVCRSGASSMARRLMRSFNHGSRRARSACEEPSTDAAKVLGLPTRTPSNKARKSAPEMEHLRALYVRHSSLRGAEGWAAIGPGGGRSLRSEAFTGQDHPNRLSLRLAGVDVEGPTDGSDCLPI